MLLIICGPMSKVETFRSEVFFLNTSVYMQTVRNCVYHCTVLNTFARRAQWIGRLAPVTANVVRTTG